LSAHRLLPIVVLWLAVFPGCRGGKSSHPPLRPQERALVDLYVRITAAEGGRAVLPESVGTALDRIASTADTTAVRAALRGLEGEPERWEYVWDAIHERLIELEEKPQPEKP
jgi:hypothetical protein